jgi:hypothetical protein
LTNATYEAIAGQPGVLGKPLSEVLADDIAPRALLEAVVSTGRASYLHHALARKRDSDAAGVRRHVSFTFLRARRVDGDADGVLILVRDVSAEVHARRAAELFTTLASDMTAERDEAATIRSSVQHGKETLGASAASIFLLSSDGRTLHGALVGWDWTRTSFVTDVEQWPNVAQAMASNTACFFTSTEAKQVEEVWFERRAVRAVVCAPMASAGRVIGVLFFDYASASPPQVDLGVAKAVADQCALLVERQARALSDDARAL